MVGKEKKGKGKSSHSKSGSSQSYKKDLTKINFFHHQELRHYAMKFTHKKAGKNSLGGVAGEALSSQFELDLTLITCMVKSMMGSVWYMDSGASFHMTRNK